MEPTPVETRLRELLTDYCRANSRTRDALRVAAIAIALELQEEKAEKIKRLHARWRWCDEHPENRERENMVIVDIGEYVRIEELLRDAAKTLLSP